MVPEPNRPGRRLWSTALAGLTLLVSACSGAVPRGLRVSPPTAPQTYTYFNSLVGSTTYLMETNTGAIVHTWESAYPPAGGMYLLDNGNLLRTSREPDAPRFRAGGMGGRIEEFTWDGDLVWEYVLADSMQRMHHDIERMPNGNVLAIVWDWKSLEEVQTKGYRPEMTPEAGLWPERIIEIEPRRPSGGRIVWEWHSWDHMIQDIDPSLDNYADPGEHPELIDINAGRQPPESMTDSARAHFREIGYVPDDDDFDANPDFMHSNGIDYNADLDQIVLSVPNWNEIWIIDHSTTTREAAGSSGGRVGRGGDLLYRWGNPQTYGRGDESDRMLGFQHDPKWVPDGMPGAGNITIFGNNTPPGDHSTIYELETPLTPSGGYSLNASEPYGPVPATWMYEAPVPTDFYSSFISGAHRLQSGNTLITSGAQGRFFEVSPAGDIVWEYWSPYDDGEALPDGTVGEPFGNNPFGVFRATRISGDHPALRGRDLTPLDPQPRPKRASEN